MQGRSLGRRVGVALATLLVAVAGLWMVRPGWLRGLMVRWFGPPPVELAETFAAVQGGSVFDHSRLDGLLAAHVDTDGFVDYPAISSDTTELDAYIAELAEAPFDDLGRDERLALLINAYNAFTLRLILDHYPIDSIKEIPGDQRWDDVRWSLAGGTYSLNQLEHELVRANFREPRIHFALVCAAVGCPPLRSEAYSGERLEEQLEAQARFTHESERWLRYRAGADTIELTSLYEWYGGDFEQVAGSVLAYVGRYDDDLSSDLAAGHEPEVRFLDYDWSLNRQEP